MPRLVVKKPFEKEELEEKREKREEQERRDSSIKNIEQEEKPAAEESTNISEDLHGGSESTESLPNTQSPSENKDSSRNKESGEEENESGQSGVEQGDDAASGSSKSEASEKTDKAGENSSEAQNTDTTGGSEAQNSDSEGGESEEGSREVENSAAAGEENTSAGSTGESHENSDSDHQGEAEEASRAGEEDSEEGEENEDFEGDEAEKQMPTMQYNTQQVIDVSSPSPAPPTKYYQTEFYRFIEMIAEEKLKVYDPKHAEEYNIKKLMFRQFERKPLNAYRMSRVRDSVILILDNSGSMQWWTENLRVLAELALERNDIEIYIAPNGHIEEKLTKHGAEPVDHEKTLKQLRGRKIIYVGDYDGADTAVQLSWSSEVIWLCPESRYRRFSAHSWVRYSEEEFKGAFLRVYNLEEMFAAIKKLLSYYGAARVWIDLHENERFYDDLPW